MLSQTRLRNTHLSPADRRTWERVKAGAEDIARIALNIIDVSRAEDGAFVLAPQRQALAAIAEHVGDALREHAADRGVALEIVSEPDLPPALVDGPIVQRVLHNLLDNALRHSGVGTRVELALRRGPGAFVELRVADEGGGIPEAQREAVFGKYARLQSGEATSADGRGLGLAFCKLAVEGHGGRISVEPNAPKGAVFVVQLPVA